MQRGFGEKPHRQSHERPVLARFSNLASKLPEVTATTGQGGANRFDLPTWELSVLQRFQFGDLRLESLSSIVVIETESGGGVTNLVKYWPLLEMGDLPKRFVLGHLFRITSENDYIAHRKLWTYLVERMETHLEGRGLTRPDKWDAAMFVYRQPDDDSLEEVEKYVRGALAQGTKSHG